jgi:phosphatidylserine/phosphatidylglycerophosphate/cardiolipin synthase-like enzyme
MYGPRTTTAFNGAPQWPYPHSKLALFDDRYALVGSSNWTYRSMEYDGEITTMIDDGDKVAQIPANRCFLVPRPRDFVRPDAPTLKTKATMDAMWTWF